MEQQLKVALLLSGALFGTTASSGAVVLSNVETFASGTAGLSFRGGIAVSNELGGTGGAADGFLSLRTSSAQRFGARINGADTAFTGDYTAIGAQAIRFSILDLDSEDSVVIRVGFGIQRANYWVSNFSIDPTFGAGWQEVLIPLDDVAGWTAIQGAGGAANFEAAKQGSSSFQFRGDATIDSDQPDLIIGSVGIDDVSFVAVPEPGVGILSALSGFVILRRQRQRI